MKKEKAQPSLTQNLKENQDTMVSPCLNIVRYKFFIIAINMLILFQVFISLNIT